MGEVMVVKDRSINRVIDLMRKDGLDEKRAIKKIINLGIQDEMGSCKPGQSPSLASLQAWPVFKPYPYFKINMFCGVS